MDAQFRAGEVPDVIRKLAWRRCLPTLATLKGEPCQPGHRQRRREPYAPVTRAACRIGPVRDRVCRRERQPSRSRRPQQRVRQGDFRPESVVHRPAIGCVGHDGRERRQRCECQCCECQCCECQCCECQCCECQCCERHRCEYHQRNGFNGRGRGCGSDYDGRGCRDKHCSVGAVRPENACWQLGQGGRPPLAPGAVRVFVQHGTRDWHRNQRHGRPASAKASGRPIGSACWSAQGLRRIVQRQLGQGDHQPQRLSARPTG